MKISPKQLFLIDGIGAIVSAFFLGVVLVAFERIVGLPKDILYVLAAIPCFFMVYSFSCYFLLKANRKPFLRGIAFANLLYCFVTIGLLNHHYDSLTFWGRGYFLLELLILAVLIRVELKSASGT